MIFLVGASLLALRPPYSVRQFQSGMQKYKNEQYESAISYFNDSLQADANQPDVLFARGRSYEKLNNFLAALEDFKKSFSLLPKAETNACMGYCMNKLRYYNVAIDIYQKTLSMGYKSAPVFNNLGFSCFQVSRLEEANRYLDQALTMDNNLQAAHHTLMLVYLKQVLNGYPLPEVAFDHAQKAIEIGPPSADLYLNTAILYAFAAKEKPDLRRAAIEYLEKAVESGVNPKKFLLNPTFSALQEEQQFKMLLTKPVGKESGVRSEYLVDPLGAR